ASAFTGVLFLAFFTLCTSPAEVVNASPAFRFTAGLPCTSRDTEPSWMSTISLPPCVCLSLSAPGGTSRCTRMASHPGPPFSSVRFSTVPLFKPSWALNIRLPTNPSTTPSANITPTNKWMRFMEAPFKSQRILAQVTGSPSLTEDWVNGSMSDIGIFQQLAGASLNGIKVLPTHTNEKKAPDALVIGAAPGALVEPEGARGVPLPDGRQKTIRGRIMSCSSCSRMWQCHTYSWPPVLGLTALRMAAVGKSGRSNFMITVEISSEFTRTVSFHPISSASGGIG